MVLHRNAKLGLAGRYALVRVVEDGCSLKAAAAVFVLAKVLHLGCHAATPVVLHLTRI